MKALGIAGTVLFFGGLALAIGDVSLIGGALLAVLGLIIAAVAIVASKVRALWRGGVELYDLARGGRPSSVVVKRVELPKPLSVITGPAIGMDLKVTNRSGEHDVSREIPVPRLIALGLLPNAIIARLFPALDACRLIKRDAERAATAPE